MREHRTLRAKSSRHFSHSPLAVYRGRARDCSYRVASAGFASFGIYRREYDKCKLIFAGIDNYIVYNCSVFCNWFNRLLKAAGRIET